MIVIYLPCSRRETKFSDDTFKYWNACLKADDEHEDLSIHTHLYGRHLVKNG